MEHWLMAHEPWLRLACFAGMLGAMALWELGAPRRPLTQPKGRRWGTNLGVVAVDTVVVRILFPTAAVGLALLAQDRGWGLLNAPAVPAWLALVLGVVLLDLVIYFQHVMFHAVPALWRLHRVHHADLDIDVTTGVRFHPVEIVLSMLLKLAAVAALGPPAVSVLVFEVLLNATSMFNHGNVYLPPAVDRWLRLVVVTPDMHRVHHSVHARETNSNFGFNLPWWDRLFGTYEAQPADGHQRMTIGLHGLRDPRRTATLGGVLGLPFGAGTEGYAINRRWSGR